jgi:hypothetical protein
MTLVPCTCLQPHATANSHFMRLILSNSKSITGRLALWNSMMLNASSCDPQIEVKPSDLVILPRVARVPMDPCLRANRFHPQRLREEDQRAGLPSKNVASNRLPDRYRKMQRPNNNHGTRIHHPHPMDVNKSLC